MGAQHLAAEAEAAAEGWRGGGPPVPLVPPSLAPGTPRALAAAHSLLAPATLRAAVLRAPERIALRLGTATEGRDATLVARRLAEAGFCVCAAGLRGAVSASAAAEARALHRRGELRSKGFVRRGRRLPHDPTQRTDLCVMLGDEPCHPLHASTTALLAIDAAIERFARRVVERMARLTARQRRLMGGGPSGERLRYSGRGDMMVAVYPGGGSFHGAHIDNQDGDGREHDFGRVLTFIYYLNQDWKDEDGGALRIFLPSICAEHDPIARAAMAAGISPVVDILPELDTLAIFRADRVIHEVRPCPTRHRYAASVWVTCSGEC
ncbi:hypothetical protein AB1Y20_023097 [Prymnesium parvum]|uniref:Fe2OG dioxygenase domain-containing protein n=1 Tax=Prymnesium parvum TaxID=97485 RepID=A0AB34JF59_PRYPA